jgi:hypothetical protein
MARLGLEIDRSGAFLRMGCIEAYLRRAASAEWSRERGPGWAEVSAGRLRLTVSWETKTSTP